MTHDADLCTALRRCQFCDDTGKLLGKLSKEAVLPCPHCRLARMAADRLETRNRQLTGTDGNNKRFYLNPLIIQCPVTRHSVKSMLVVD